MSLFRANKTVANFWLLFATLSAYVVVALEVDPEVDREALAHVACAQIFLFERLFRPGGPEGHQKTKGKRTVLGAQGPKHPRKALWKTSRKCF